MASISATRALTQVLQTDEDVAALNALAPAVVRPAPDVADKLEYRDEDCSESVAGLSLSAFKITGLTETTFVWRYVRMRANESTKRLTPIAQRD